ncbi:unnamed protein product [Ectocarpus fasciculatus]
MRDERCWRGRAAMVGAAISCLLGPGLSFVTTLPSPRGTTDGPPPRHRTALASSNSAPSAAEAVHSVFLESVLETTTRKQVGSIEEAKTELLGRVGFPTDHPGAERPRLEEARVGYLVEVLEGTYTPIHTVDFFNFAAQGEWDLAYTTAAMLPIGPRLTANQLFQRIEPGEGLKGNLTNIIMWTLKDEGIDGRLEVDCDYSFDPRGRMNTSLRKHLLLPDGKMPRDPQGLIQVLRRAMPYELFDPDGHALETTFLDDTLRIVKLRGPKFEGLINIFARRATAKDSATDAEAASETDPEAGAASAES